MAADILVIGAVGSIGQVTGIIEKAIHIAFGRGVDGSIGIGDESRPMRIGRIPWDTHRSDLFCSGRVDRNW